MSWEQLRYYELASLGAEGVVSEFWRLFTTWGTVAVIILLCVVIWDAWRK